MPNDIASDWLVVVLFPGSKRMAVPRMTRAAGRMVASLLTLDLRLKMYRVIVLLCIFSNLEG